MPLETVSTCPVSLAPETVGVVETNGGVVTLSVDALNLMTDPRELAAATRNIRCLPTSKALSTRVLAVAPLIAKQSADTESEAEATSESHLNHWYV